MQSRKESQLDTEIERLKAQLNELQAKKGNPPPKEQNNNFQGIYDEALNAGMHAGNAITPVPMGVTDGTTHWHVPDGVCGFAWVVIRPGTSAFARWLVKNGYARPAFGGGVSIWISEHNQSMTRKEENARAMAKVMQKSFPKLKIYSQSRMD